VIGPFRSETVTGNGLMGRNHLVDLVPPLIAETLGPAWRERLMDPLAVHSDPAARDRDHKLLAWLEYAEILAEGELDFQYSCSGRDRISIRRDTQLTAVNEDQRGLRREAMRDESPSKLDVRAADGMVDLWRKFGGRADAWASAWNARNDPYVYLPTLIRLWSRCVAVTRD
jgi:hypothetical protein